MIGNKIANIAAKYLGQSEKPNNSGFHDAVFEMRMRQVGWQKSQAWCAYFAEMVYKEAYESTQYIFEVNKYCSASATTTYKNFDIAKNWQVSQTPQIGALAVWRHGISWQGHIGIVSSVFEDKFTCIEGNTNNSGGREGIEVAEKTRKLDFTVKENALNLIGFVIPLQP